MIDPKPPEKPKPAPTGDDAVQQMKRLTRRAFTVGGLSFLAGYGAWTWLQSRSSSDGVAWPFRKVHELNEGVAQALYSGNHLAPEFDLKYAAEPKVNGWIGWDEDQPAAKDWKLEIEIPDQPIKRITLDQLTKLPRMESIFEFKCIEGWSQIVQWGGYRFGDFLKAFDLLPPDGSPLKYVHLSTMNDVYTSALDLPSAMHPQAMLCDTMNGIPLTEGHGAPIRMVLPVKYGIKNIKWLAKIRFQETRPTDYWTERGYDWYAGL